MNHTTSRRRSALGALALAALLIPAACASDSDDSSASVSTTADSTAAPASSATETSDVETSDVETSDVETSDVDGTTRTFEAQNGAIEIPVAPQRIVACGYATLPLLQAGANLVASCEWTRELAEMSPDVRTAYDALPKVGANADASTFNYEAIAAAEPDLIILGIPVFALEQVDMPLLEALAPVVMMGPSKPTDWRTLGVQFADAANVSDEYGESQGRYATLAADIADRYADLSDLTFGGICTTCAGDPGTFYREYAGSYITNLFGDLGLSFPGKPALADGPQHGEFISQESLSESFADVDVIVYGLDADGKVPAAAAELFESPLWKALPAVQAGNVIAVEHAAASTYETAILALESIDASLATLPAFTAG